MRKNPARRVGGWAIIALILALPYGQALATSNRWQAVSGNYTGDFGDSGHWSLGSVPATTDVNVIFDNQQSTAYTVRLTNNAVNGLIRVTTDKVTYDLNGYTWYAPALEAADYYCSNPTQSHVLAHMAGETGTVTFSSSRGPQGTNGNSLDLGQGLYAGAGFGDGTRASTFIIDDSLGYPVKLILPWDSSIFGANLVISGAGSELSQPNGVFHTWAGNILVKNGGLLNIWANYSLTYFAVHAPIQSSTTTVDNATLMTYGQGACIGYSTKGTLILSNNAVWMAGPKGISATEFRFYDGVSPYLGNISVDRSSIYDGGSFTIGETNNAASAGYALGNVELGNGSVLVVSNGALTINPQTFTVGGQTYSNRLVLRDSTIVLGCSTNNGGIVNAGIFQAAGAIVGQGPAKATLENRNFLSVGSNCIGILSLTNCDLQNTVSGTVFLEFNAATNDQIAISGGTAMIGGTVTFTNMAGFRPRTKSGKKWDFVRAASITYTATDNMTSLMTAIGLTVGGDYTFGVVTDGAFQALRLKINVPSGTVIAIH